MGFVCLYGLHCSLICLLTKRWQYGIVLCMYLDVRAKFTLYLSELLTWWPCVTFLGNIFWFFKCFVHFKAKSRHLFVLLTDRVSSPDISRAAEYSTYMSPRIIFRAVFCILSCLLLCSIVRLEWNTTEQYSARLRIYNTYTSIRSSIATPTYFSLVSICILEKASLQISEQFSDQERFFVM